MKVFRAALCLLFATFLIIIFNSFFNSFQASADEGRRYAMATSRDVYLYSKMEKNTELFAIPYTYCVEILQEYDEWYHVRYAKDDGLYEQIIGYCKKENIREIDEPPENIYLHRTVDLTLSSGNNGDSALPELNLSVTAAFYGNFYRGDTSYIYLLYNGGFGYLEGEIDDYDINEIPSAPTFAEGQPTEETGDSALVPVIVIASLALAAIIVLIITGNRKKRGVKRDNL